MQVREQAEQRTQHGDPRLTAAQEQLQEQPFPRSHSPRSTRAMRSLREQPLLQQMLQLEAGPELKGGAEIEPQDQEAQLLVGEP